MISYLSIVLGMLMLPAMYAGLILWYRPYFTQEKNQKRKPLQSFHEKTALLFSELALLRIWYATGRNGFNDFYFLLLYLMLAAMMAFCMIDSWEQIVPNKLLLIFLFVFMIAVGVQGLRDLDGLIAVLPSIVFGVVFCTISFGAGYLLSRRTMGAGDVKLSLLMGLYLTGEYVVGAVVYGCLTAALYSGIQLLRKKLARKDMIPFVPFLYIGLIIRYFIG